MKKRVILSLLLAGTLVGANDYKYEISPMIGYNLSEGNIGLKDDGHFTGGVEAQFNTLKSKLSPEFSVLQSRGVNYKTGGDTQITRGAFNGVYTFEPTKNIVPFAKMGLGIENISDQNVANRTGMFVDAGVGLKVPLTKAWAFKAEAIYLAKVNNKHNKYSDNNLIGLIGLTYSFGAYPSPKIVEKKPKLDSDDDGVYDESDKCPNTPANTRVDSNGCKVFLDDDKDGIENSLDKCPTTPANTRVDSNGCKLFLDGDKDGIENSLDKCPNTPIGVAVNSNGCPVNINLNINFETNSYTVKEMSLTKIDDFANFLKKYKVYSAKIVGYTDSRGNNAYNKKLSQERADAVKKLLIEKGVDASRLTTIGMGEVDPIASNKTAEGRAQNRRIEANLTLN